MGYFKATEIASAVNGQSQSALSIAEQVLGRLANYDTIQPQTWITRPCPDQLRLAATHIDARVKAGEFLPLAGVPFAVKDNIDVADFPTTAGCPAFAYTPLRNAFVVERLLKAGALFVGKTNLDQFATGLVGTRSPYGAPQCVFNRNYVSGGSSSGSAVATAAQLVSFALGTDTAGSGRVPAAFNNLLGLKPTKGRWSTQGLVPACRSLDCITVFAHNAADVRLVDDVVAGFDANDPFSRRFASVPSGERIGIPLPHQREFFGDNEAAWLYDKSIARLKQQGRVVSEIDISSLLETANLLYSGPWVAERTAAVGDFLLSNPEAIERTVLGILQAGLQVSGVDAFRGYYRLAELARAAEAIWVDVDILALPTAPTIYRIGELDAAPLALNSNLGRYTNFVNLLDMAAIAVPAGFRKNGTGFGITFVAPAWTDLALIDQAEKWCADMPWAVPELDLEGRMDMVELAVVGAHLKDMSLHWQLASRDAEFIEATTTAPTYRLFAMANTNPPKPALFHAADGAPIAVELYRLSAEAFGSFVAEVPSPLAIGSVELIDGRFVKGFVAEPRAKEGALDITEFGGWRDYIASLQGTGSARQV